MGPNERDFDNGFDMVGIKAVENRDSWNKMITFIMLQTISPDMELIGSIALNKWGVGGCVHRNCQNAEIFIQKWPKITGSVLYHTLW